MFELHNDPNSSLTEVVFSLNAAPGRRVAVAGSFNDWDPSAALMSFNAAEGVYSATVHLASGKYEYKFVVDGEWVLDESNPDFSPNDFGTLNSELTVP